MNMNENHNEYNFLYFSSQQSDQYPDRPNEINSYENTNNHQIDNYQRKLDYYYKSKVESQELNYNKNNYLHFDFNADRKENDENNQNKARKKNKTVSYSDNLSFIERIKESNLNYVGFENKQGENCCYLNVILHFLSHFPCINIFLIKFYKNMKKQFIDINNNINNNSISSENDDYFFFLLGKTLYEYELILANNNNKGITILHTNELRNYLQLISKNFYSLNKVADPVELLTFLLEKINDKNNVEVHKYFYINLIEEINCNDSCKNKDIKIYDENNFIHLINVKEIFEYIDKNKLSFDEYYHQLFRISKCDTETNLKRCKNCNETGKTLLKLIGPNYPTFFLLNCTWDNYRPKLENVLKFLYLVSLEDTLNSIFNCEKNNGNLRYNLLGMILYSGALSHYISFMFNMEKRLFVLYNDDKIKELSTIHEVYKEITAEQIKNNPDTFYYPVLLIYYKEIIYADNKTRFLNEYSYSKYCQLIDYCDKATKRHLPLTKEQKEKNHKELIEAQIRANRKMTGEHRNKHLDMIIEEESTRKSANNINNNSKININDKNDMDVEDEKEKIFQFEDEEEHNDKKRINKRYLTDYKRSNIFPKINHDFFPDII